MKTSFGWAARRRGCASAASESGSSRWTIEISEAQRAELLRLDASRGEKGFSAVVREALDFYLAHQGGRSEAIRAVFGLKGALPPDEADAMSAEIAMRREHRR